MNDDLTTIDFIEQCLIEHAFRGAIPEERVTIKNYLKYLPFNSANISRSFDVKTGKRLKPLHTLMSASLRVLLYIYVKYDIDDWADVFLGSIHKSFARLAKQHDQKVPTEIESCMIYFFMTNFEDDENACDDPSGLSRGDIMFKRINEAVAKDVQYSMNAHIENLPAGFKISKERLETAILNFGWLTYAINSEIRQSRTGVPFNVVN